MEAELLKAHVKGYAKKDGTYVKPHERGPLGRAPESHYHAKPGEDGKPVLVKWPHHASAASTWHSPDAVATFLPDGDVPAELNGIPIRRWRDHPTTAEGWGFCDGVNDDLHEPEFNLPPGKKAAAGVIIEEKDGRCWLVAPTNGFGGYEHTWPKGSVDPNESLQSAAIRETWEETGLQIKITGYLGDFERTTSVARMYRAMRVGGNPSEMGWETQAMVLLPKSALYDHLNGPADWPIAEAVGAGPAPKIVEKDDMIGQKLLFGGLFGKK